MPCNDWGSSGGVSYVDNPETKRRLDLATRVACITLRSLDAAKIDSLPREVSTWWAAHQEMDRRRVNAEREEERRAELKRRALAKLTPEEKKVLSLR